MALLYSLFLHLCKDKGNAQSCRPATVEVLAALWAKSMACSVIELAQETPLIAKACGACKDLAKETA
jgi:hypothetical protein